MTATLATDSFPALGSRATVATTDPYQLSQARGVVEEVVASYGGRPLLLVLAEGWWRSHFDCELNVNYRKWHYPGQWR